MSYHEIQLCINLTDNSLSKVGFLNAITLPNAQKMLILRSDGTTIDYRTHCIIIYLLNASRGDKREAFQAGNIPDAILSITDSTHTFKRSLTTNTGVI